jgi:hypothetical protein
MALNKLTSINEEVQDLMGEADERIWQEAGLFTSIDNIWKKDTNNYSTLQKEVVHPARYPSVSPPGGGVDCQPTHTDSLPSLSDSGPEVHYHTSGGNQSFEGNKEGFSGFQKKAVDKIYTLANIENNGNLIRF